MHRASVLVLVMIVGLSACDNVSYVDRIVIRNDTSYSPRVEVRGETGGWLALATVEPRATKDIGRVIDQGEEWIFRFSYGRREPVVVEIERDDLADSDWTVEVPEEFEQRLREDNVPLPP